MKKSIAIIVMVFTLLLSSCGAPQNDASHSSNSKEIDNQEETVWSGVGGCFKQKPFEDSDNCIGAFANESDIYTISLDLSTFTPRICTKGTEVLYKPEIGEVSCATVTDEGIWVVNEINTDGKIHNYICLISFDGDVMNTIQLDNVCQVEGFIYSILRTSNNIYLEFEECIVVISADGKMVSTIELPDPNSRIVMGDDNCVYVINNKEESNEIYKIDDTNSNLSLKITAPQGTIFSGSDENFLLLSTSDGLYGLGSNGETTPIVIWEECGINFTNLRRVVVLPDKSFLCFDGGGSSIIYPIDPKEFKRKKELVIATIGNRFNKLSTVSNFNFENEEYTVKIMDYSENGTYDANKSITRLNTVILSGNFPDMILFSEIAPFQYIKKGYLVDLKQKLQSDSEINCDDITILKQLEVEDGLYYVDNVFFIESLMGLYSKFGDSYGWTIDDYLDIEKTAPKDAETMYNVTKRNFLLQIAERYISTAVEWESGTCDFDNDQFIDILEASNRIKENPEDPNNMDFTPGGVRVAKGTLIASASWVDTVWNLAYEKEKAGCKLSFIGWPTADGSCGSDIQILEPVGICSQSENIDACWEFIKFMLKDIDQDSMYGLPVYKPMLEASIEKALTDEEIQEKSNFSKSDSEEFYSFLDEIDNVALYDQAILNIIEEESEPFFAGDKDAKETAKLIQSRAAIYLSEQS